MPINSKTGKKIEVDIPDEIYELADRILRGKQVKYDKSFHVPLLVSLFSAGHDIASFCSRAGMARSTFFEWKEHHKEFAEAYAIAKERSREYFEITGMKGMQDPGNFNCNAWSMQMRNRFGYTDKRKIQIKNFDKAKNANEQIKKIAKEISQGTLTDTEASNLTNIVVATIKIDEHTTLKDTLKSIDDRLKAQEDKA